MNSTSALSAVRGPGLFVSFHDLKDAGAADASHAPELGMSLSVLIDDFSSLLMQARW
jgi:hypothetical protein